MSEAILSEPLERVQTERACPISGTHDACVVSVRARDGSPLRNVISCDSGLVFVDPPPISNLTAFYAHEYRREYKASPEPATRRVLRAGRASLARMQRLWRHVAARRGQPGGLRTLDVGASSGEFVLLMQQMGCVAMGCEPNESFARFAREKLRANVQTGMLADVPLEPASYDLITLFHVVEHMDDPRGSLERFRQLLRPGGTLVIEVPNILSMNMGFAHKWHKGHLFGYSRHTLATMAQRSGYRVLELGATGDDHNVWIVCTPQEGAPDPTAGAADGGLEAGRAHFDEAVRALRANARAPYALSKRTWTAAGARLARTIAELGTLGVRDPRAMLLKLYAPHTIRA